MEQEYYALIRELSRGKMTVILDTLNNSSIDKLEELAVVEWNPYLGETLYNMIMFHRKRKLNEQFAFSPGNIEAIIHLDRLFKESCLRLKNETENQFFHLLERKECNPNVFHFLIDACLKISTFKSFNSFLDCAHQLYDTDLFSSFICENEECGGLEAFRQLPIFYFTTNYADKLTDNNILTKHHNKFCFLLILLRKSF